MKSKKEIKDRTIIQTLLALKKGGANVSDDAEARLKQYEAKDEYSWFFKKTEDSVVGNATLPDVNSTQEAWVSFIEEYPDLVTEEITTGTYSSKIEQVDKWDDLCKENPKKAFDILRIVYEKYEHSNENQWSAQRWARALSILHTECKKNDLSSVVKATIHFLSSIDDEKLFSVVNETIDMLIVNAILFVDNENIYSNNNKFFEQFIQRIIELISHDKYQTKKQKSVNYNIDYVIYAINSPEGRIADLVLKYQTLLARKFEQGLQEIPKHFLEILLKSEAPAFCLSRCIIANRSVSLFRYDAEWAKENIMNLFSWKSNPEEAPAIWQGYLWAGQWRPDFLSEIREDFLMTSRNLDKISNFNMSYVQLITFLALDNTFDVFTIDEYHECFLEFDEENLLTALSTVNNVLESASNPEKLWANSIEKFFDKVWPVDESRFTDHMADNLENIVLNSGKKFPNAVERLLPIIALKSDHKARFDTDEKIKAVLPSGKNYIKKFPAETLSFLAKSKVSIEYGESKELLARMLSDLPKTQYEDNEDYRYLVALLEKS